MDYIETNSITFTYVPYSEKDRIVTLFTKNLGLITLRIKNLSIKKTALFALSAPFTKANLTLKQRNGFYSLYDVEILKEASDIKKSFSYLSIASKMAKAITKSQLEHKRAIPLYTLFSSYLEKIPLFSKPKLLLSSFYLKTLRYEGLIHIKPTCNRCIKNTSFFSQGEGLCENCAPAFSHPLSELELKAFVSLLEERSFSGLEKIHLSQLGEEKIHTIFYELIK